MARRFKRFRRKFRRLRRKRFGRRKLRAYRSGKSIKYDGQYKAKCTVPFNQNSTAANYSPIYVGWGMAPVGGNVLHHGQSAEFDALRNMWREYKIQGFKVTLNFVGSNATTVQLAGAAGYVQGGVLGIDKGSFQNYTAAQQLALTQANIVACYDYKFSPCRNKLSYYVRVNKFWRSVNGQQWIRGKDVPPGGAPAFYQPQEPNTDNYTVFGIQTTGYPANTLIGAGRIDYYIKFRGLTV